MKDIFFNLNDAILSNNLNQIQRIISNFLNVENVKVDFVTTRGQTVLNIKGQFSESDISHIKNLISSCDACFEINDRYGFKYNELMESMYH